MFTQNSNVTRTQYLTTIQPFLLWLDNNGYKYKLNVFNVPYSIKPNNKQLKARMLFVKSQL